MIIELIPTVLPEPVAPAIKRWGIFPKSANQGFPLTSLPIAIDKFVLRFLNESEVNVSFKDTKAFF